MHQTPDLITAARRLLTDPALVAALPLATTQDAWWLLKEAQGQPITARAAARLMKQPCDTRPAIHPRNHVLADLAAARAEAPAAANPVLAATRAALAPT
ncbi:hypothetical protein, partial [Puniceibacterium confluentis]|uniref:hypothetical protein n=1 Tax=Puniceibacterium confluentis TaxID=1958944 RepID=UPI001C941846